MAFLNAMNISASAMTAERMRMDIASENIANMNVTRRADGQEGPYRRKMVVFQSIGKGQSFKDTFNSKLNQSIFEPSSVFRGSYTSTSRRLAQEAPKGGVKVTAIVEDNRDLKPVYNPNHPDADENGYVMLPNVDLLKETVDFMSATQSYNANMTAFNTMKSMATKALELGQ